MPASTRPAQDSDQSSPSITAAPESEPSDAALASMLADPDVRDADIAHMLTAALQHPDPTPAKNIQAAVQPPEHTRAAKPDKYRILGYN